MRNRDLKIKVLEMDLSDCKFVSNTRIVIDDSLYTTEDFAIKYFRDKNWNVTRPVRDFSMFKKDLVHIINKEKKKHLKKILDSIKNYKKPYLPAQRHGRKKGVAVLIPTLLGIPDFFMYKDWMIDENENYIFNPIYRFCEIKSQNMPISYNQIKWALDWNIPELYYVYIVQQRREEKKDA